MTQEQEFQQILRVLYTMKRSDKNHELLVEYFLENFQYNPEKWKEFIKILKHELRADNPYVDKIIRRYTFIFSFLCERLWYYEEKLELDDIIFQISEPEEYNKLKKLLAKYQKSSKKIINEIEDTLSNLLNAKLNIPFIIKWRYKNLYSLHKKIQKKKSENIFQLWDIFAFRIIIDDNESLCYHILSLLHNTYSPIVSRFKDYITIPKINGYQSLHTCITWIHKDIDMPVEIQIRTQIMDMIAEWWIAAHYHYARKKRSTLLWEKQKQLIEKLEEDRDMRMSHSFVYCLTPKWKIIKLSTWSNVLDFAGKIHSKLISSTRYALVNSSKVELDYMLKNFDIIELI